MSNPVILKLPEDTSGVSPYNLIRQEPHVTIQRRNRIIVPEYGAFYKDSVKIFDQVTGNRLADSDFDCVEPSVIATEKSRKEVFSLIIIRNQALTSNRWFIDYQAYGGDSMYSTDAVARMYNDVMSDTRPVDWGDILGKPQEFAPTAHLSDIGDEFGFEYLVQALESIRQAIVMGDAASHDAIYRYIDTRVTELNGQVARLDRRIDDHITDYDNPHRLTKDQLDLGNIPNLITDRRDWNTMTALLTAKAMYDHTQSGDHDDRYMRLEEGSLPIKFRWRAGKLEAFNGTSWYQIYPAVYS